MILIALDSKIIWQKKLCISFEFVSYVIGSKMFEMLTMNMKNEYSLRTKAKQLRKILRIVESQLGHYSNSLVNFVSCEFGIQVIVAGNSSCYFFFHLNSGK